ncbi:MAG: hypothetical protein AAGD11_05605 [Planctomycetota bacterium]
MGGLIRILFPLIGYFCVATVITLAAGYGFLRSNGLLDDESMFQIIALVHGVDLDEIAEANNTDEQDVPPEEMSFEDHQTHLRMSTLHLQAKQNDIEKLIADFRAERNRLDNQIDNITKFRQEVEEYLNQKRAKATADGVAGVREHWKNLNPKKQTKQLLIQMIRDGQMDRVIELLNGLNPNTRKEILKTFDTEDDIQMLYQIEQQMLTGGPDANFIDGKLSELNQGSTP